MNTFVLNYCPELIFMNSFVVHFRNFYFNCKSINQKMNNSKNIWWWASETISKE
jgi:hypothetical protein